MFTAKITYYNRYNPAELKTMYKRFYTDTDLINYCNGVMNYSPDRFVLKADYNGGVFITRNGKRFYAREPENRTPQTIDTIIKYIDYMTTPQTKHLTAEDWKLYREAKLREHRID